MPFLSTMFKLFSHYQNCGLQSPDTIIKLSYFICSGTLLFSMYLSVIGIGA